jgi:hypothetical protein
MTSEEPACLPPHSAASAQEDGSPDDSEKVSRRAFCLCLFAAGSLIAAITAAAASPPYPEGMVYPVPPGFVTSNPTGYVSSLAGTRGFVSGYTAVYESPRSAGLGGIQVIVTFVAVFRTDADAAAELAKSSTKFACRNSIPFAAGTHVSGTHAYCNSLSDHIRTYSLFWRHGEIVSFLGITGIFGVTPHQLVAIAHKQDALIAHPGANPALIA